MNKGSEISHRLIIRPMDSPEKSNEIILINELMRAAYSEEFAASHESLQATQRRVKEGECHVALFDGSLVGCVILRTQSKPSAPQWYQREGIASIGRFAVHPAFQKQGVASALLNFAETQAKYLGCVELALDTAEHSQQLIRFYEKRGYRIVASHQWSQTSFKSVVLSKPLL